MAFTYFFLGALFFLLSLETFIAAHIPFASILRFAFPIILLVSHIFAPKKMHRSHLSMFLWLFAFVGILSTLCGNSLLLGGIKLYLYLSVLFPLLQSLRIHTAFAPSSRGLLFLEKISLGILVLCVLMLPGRLGGIFKNPNQLGLFTVIVVPLAFYRITTPGTHLEKNSGLFMLLLCVTLVIFSKSRGGAAAMLVSILVFFSLRRSASISRILLHVLMLLIFGGLTFALSSTIQKRFLDYAYKGDKAVVDGARQMMFEETLSAFQKRPMLGYGFGLSWLVDSNAEKLALRTGRLSWAVGEFGNSTLAMLSGGGLVLVFVFYSMISVILMRGLRFLRCRQRESTNYAFAAALTAGICGMLVSAQSEAWLMSPMTFSTVFFWLYCGLLLHVSDLSRSSGASLDVSHTLYLRKISAISTRKNLSFNTTLVPTRRSEKGIK